MKTVVELPKETLITTVLLTPWMLAKIRQTFQLLIWKDVMHIKEILTVMVWLMRQIHAQIRLKIYASKQQLVLEIKKAQQRRGYYGQA